MFSEVIIGYIGIVTHGAVCMLYFCIAAVVHQDMKENIILHLDGNMLLYDSFYTMTLARSTIKLDVIANMLFYVGLVFVIVMDQLINDYGVWTALAVSFSLLLVAAYVGSYKAVVSVETRMYKIYFILRLMVELFKVVLILNWYISDRILWAEVINSEWFTDK